MHKDIQNKFETYPEPVKPLLIQIHTLIFDIAQEQDLGSVEESLKWGEPNYVVKSGTAVRFDWKPKSPELYFIFFNCKTKLVDTFRELYSDKLEFQGNRAIVLSVDGALPYDVLKHCIALSMNYKNIKHLPLLGE